MAVDFPGSPTNGQVFSVGGASWRYNGYAWARIPDPGEKGQKGQKGEVGEKGQKGQQGDKGVQGNFGGATFDYTFSDATGTPTDLNTGRLRLNNSTVSSATTIFIDDEDDNGTDIQPFLRTIDDSTSTIKGHVRISNKLNADDFALFTISSTTEQSGFHQISVGYVSGSATSFTNGEDIIVTFARTGDQGQKGEQGIQGIKGVQDKIFEGDTEAEVVDTGGNGHFKVTTEGTERFKIDNVGLATFTNDVVISNTLFFNKTVNAISKIDHDGGNLDLHSDGFIRFYESDGDTLMFTFDVNTTHNDARLILENDTDTFFNHPDNNQLGFTVGGTETIRIHAGKVGINSSFPNKQLDVIGDSGMLVASATNANGISIFLSDNRTSNTSDLSQVGEINYKHADTNTPEQSYSDVLTFKSNQNNLAVNVEGFLLVDTNSSNNGGRVGIGTSIPEATVDIQGTSSAFPILNLGGGSTNGDLTVNSGESLQIGHWNRTSNNFSERFNIGPSGQFGIAGANYGSSGQVLTSQGGSSAPIWNSLPAAVTYDLITSSVGSNVQLLLDASTGDDDPILITAGTNVSFAGVSATGFTINTVDTSYDLITANGDNANEEKIQLTGSDSTTDTVILAVSTGLSIARDTTSGKITLTNTDTGSGSNTFIGLTDTPSSFTANKTLKVNGAGNAVIFADDNNTTFALSAADGDTTTQEKIVLTGTNPTSTDNVILEVSTGLSIARTGNTITFANTAPDTNTTYDLITSSSGSNVILKLDASEGDDDPITISAGSNITLTENGSGTGFTIASSFTNTQLTTEQVEDIVGDMFSSNTETRIVATYADNGTGRGKINLVVDDMTSDDNTTYLLKAQQTGGNNDNPNLLLDASSGTDDTVQLIGGTNCTITRNNDGQITFDAVNTNTQLTTEQVQDIVGNMFSGNTETRISATYQDGDGTIDLVVDDMTANTNTTYDLITSSSGDNVVLTLDASAGDDDPITITKGDNVSFTNVTSTGFTINTSATIDVTQLNLNRIRFGPGASGSDDANIEWLGGSNDGHLRISTSDDNGAEYIELGDYDNINLGGTFTRWMKLNRSELYMDRDVRLNAGLEDKDGQKGSNGQVLVSTGSQVNWVDSNSVGENTQLTTEQVQDIVGAMFTSNTETRISASYQDSDGTIDLVVDDMTADTNTTYTAGGDYGMTLSGTQFRLKSDRRRNSNSTDIYTGNTHDYTFYDASHGIRWYTSGSEEMRLENDGDLHVDGDIIAYSTTVPSDIRLKKDLQIIQNPLDIINKINGYTYTYKKDDKKSAGVVAQEVEKVFPQAVSEKGLPFSSKDEENPDNYKTVEYDQIVGLLVQAVKELTDKVKKLESR